MPEPQDKRRTPGIRLILLPVVLRLTGRGGWYRPRWLARILPDVRFSH